MRTTLLIIFSLITIFSGYCNEKEAIKNDSTRWITALESANLDAIDSLLEQQVNFTLLDTNDLDCWDIEFSEIENDLLSKIYYYCLNQNGSYASTIQNQKYYYRNDLIHSYYTNGDRDKIYGNYIFSLQDSNGSINYEYDNKIKLLSEALTKN